MNVSVTSYSGNEFDDFTPIFEQVEDKLAAGEMPWTCFLMWLRVHIYKLIKSVNES